MFVFYFGALAVTCALAAFYSRGRSAQITDKAFGGFARQYLIVYLLAAAGDWLQGPYVYALYEFYGMTKQQIEVLFIAGFGSSMLFGTVVGSVADKYGRRLNCYMYGLLYGISCLTKHSNQFEVLMVGRILGGIATSILFSAFESWLVCEHHKRGFSDDALATLFSYATFGNSLVAIVAGVAAQMAASTFGFAAPFDMSLCMMVVMCIALASLWSENYGDETAEVHASFSSGLSAIRNDPKVLYLGLIQSLFESAMYVFVLEWTPALGGAAQKDTPIPHGLIFSCFMVCIMIASSLFKLLSSKYKVESFMRYTFAVGSISLFLPVVFPSNMAVVFNAFLVFEICVGLFWPGMGCMRSQYIPETSRSTIMNLFRVPLNIVVVLILLNDLPLHIIFSCCAAFLGLAALLQHRLYGLVIKSAAPSSLPTTIGT